MHILSRLRLRTMLALLKGLSALALVASIAVASSIMHQRMLHDRLDKLHSMSQATSGIAQALEDHVAARAMTHEQALDQFRKAIHAIHFDAGDGYIVAQMLETNTIVAHGTNPASRASTRQRRTPAESRLPT